MVIIKDKQTILDVPYYQQKRYSTCGPASLMMVMKYWDKNFNLSKRNEFLLWIRSNPFIFLGGTLQFGLAKTAVNMGFKVKIFQKSRFSEIRVRKHYLINLYEYIASLGARKKKVQINYDSDIFKLIVEYIDKKYPPILFVNLYPLIGENVLHWFVVTGMDSEYVYVNDPYVPYGVSEKSKINFPIEHEVFKQAISTDKSKGLRLPPCIILVYK